MTSRTLTEVFDRCRREERAALVAFLAAGDPNPDVTTALGKAVIHAGADILELGIPFSDPLADGPIIQAAYTRALAAQTDVRSVLDAAADIVDSTGAPVVLMTSWNPILAHGVERFCGGARAAGVAGVLVPDLLPDDAAPFRSRARADGLDTIFLAAPGMTATRLAAASDATTGFLYLVSRRGVTGPRGGVGAALEQEVARARSVCDKPIAVGFGVSSAEDAIRVARCADGVIVGSALVRVVAEALRDDPEASPSAAAIANAVAAVTRVTTELVRGVRSARVRGQRQA